MSETANAPRRGDRPGRVEVGSAAPDFALPSQTGEIVRLSDFAGKRAVVLYFYIKDNSGG